MIDQVAIGIATGAAGNLIAYLLNSQVDALRSTLMRLFHRSSEQDRALVLKQLDEDALALAQKTRTTAELTAKWSATFTGLLGSDPQVRKDLASFATAPIPPKTVHIGSQHNHGSGIFIGGDNHGRINTSTNESA